MPPLAGAQRTICAAALDGAGENLTGDAQQRDGLVTPLRLARNRTAADAAEETLLDGHRDEDRAADAVSLGEPSLIRSFGRQLRRRAPTGDRAVLHLLGPPRKRRRRQLAVSLLAPLHAPPSPPVRDGRAQATVEQHEYLR